MRFFAIYHKLFKFSKNYFLLFIFCFVFNTVLYSQSKFGFKCGINRNSFGKDDDLWGVPYCHLTYNSKTTLPHVGFEYFYKIHHNLFIFTEILYVVKGSDVQMNFKDYGNINSFIRLNYLEFPLMIKYSPLKHAAIGIGPYIGLYLFGKTKEYNYIRVTGILNSDNKIITANKLSKGINIDIDIIFNKFIITIRESKTLNMELKYNQNTLLKYKKNTYTNYISFNYFLNNLK